MVAIYLAQRPLQQVFIKKSDNQWLLSTASGLESRVYIASIDCTLLLSEVYDKVQFPVEPAGSC